jgi:hypothetical protein
MDEGGRGSASYKISTRNGGPRSKLSLIVVAVCSSKGVEHGWK